MISTNHLWKFHHIYNLGAVGDGGELIRFWGQRLKVKGHSETTCGQISTLGANFDVPLEYMDVFEWNLSLITRPLWHRWLYRDHGSDVNVKVTETVPTMHFSGEGISVDCSLLKNEDHPVFCGFCIISNECSWCTYSQHFCMLISDSVLEQTDECCHFRISTYQCTSTAQWWWQTCATVGCSQVVFVLHLYVWKILVGWACRWPSVPVLSGAVLCRCSVYSLMWGNPWQVHLLCGK